VYNKSAIMTEVKTLPQSKPTFNTIASINDDFDVSILPDFPTPSLDPHAVRSNSLLKLRAYASTPTLPTVSLVMSSSGSTASTRLSLTKHSRSGPQTPVNVSTDLLIGAQSRTRSPAISSQPILPSNPCSLLSSRTSLAEWTVNEMNDSGACQMDEDDLDMATVDDGIDDHPHSHSKMDKLASSAISGPSRPCTNTKGATYPTTKSEVVSKASSPSPPRYPFHEATSMFICDEHKYSDSEDSESDDDPLYAITPMMAVCESETSPIGPHSALSPVPDQLDLGPAASNPKVTVIRTATLWGRKENAIPTKHGQQHIVEWKFATMDRKGNPQGHTLVLQHKQHRRGKRKSKRMVMLDGKVLFDAKCKRTEWKSLSVPQSNDTLSVIIQERNGRAMKFEYVLKIGGVPYSAAFRKWQQQQ